jgi:hypothetical protein
MIICQKAVRFIFYFEYFTNLHKLFKLTNHSPNTKNESPYKNKSFQLLIIKQFNLHIRWSSHTIQKWLIQLQPKEVRQRK